MRLIIHSIVALLAIVAVAHSSPAIDTTTLSVGCTHCSSFSLPALSTNNANEPITVFTATQGAGKIVSITDTAGLVWIPRTPNTVSGPASDQSEEWAAFATGVLTNDVITIHWPNTINSGNAFAFSIKGASTSSPYDPLWGNPTTVPQTTSPTTVTITTVGTDDLIVGFYRFSGSACNPLQPGAGWSQIISLGAGGQIAEYNNFLSAQTNLSVALPCTSTVVTGIADAFVGPGGLGADEESPKINSYAVLESGTQSSKINTYAILEPAEGVSKIITYAVLLGQMNVVSPNTGLTLFHAFPP